MFRSHAETPAAPRLAGRAAFPVVDEEAEKARIHAAVEVDVTSMLPTSYSPREKPPLREQEVAVRHSELQREVGAWAAASERQLDEELTLGEAALVEAERQVDGVQRELDGRKAELEAADDELKREDGTRRFEKLPPLLLYALPLLIAAADFSYTSDAFAVIGNKADGRGYATGALLGQMVAYHFLGTLLKDLVARPMNRARRRLTVALVATLGIGALVFGIGIVAVRAAAGSSDWSDSVMFAGLQLLFAVTATTVAFVAHSPLAAHRRKVATEVRAVERRLTAAQQTLAQAEQALADLKATADTFSATVAERTIGVQHAFEGLVLYARRVAQARFTEHDATTERAELLEHFPLPQMVLPVRDGDLADEPLLAGPVQLRLF